ncbi:MAG: YceD family protein, partial [Bacilli bacterium]
RTLEPVNYPIDLQVTEIFDTQMYDDDSRLIEKNTVDLRPVVWENVYLEKPIRIVKEEIPQ